MCNCVDAKMWWKNKFLKLNITLEYNINLERQKSYFSIFSPDVLTFYYRSNAFTQLFKQYLLCINMLNSYFNIFSIQK